MSTINSVFARRVVNRYRRLKGDLLERGIGAPRLPTDAEPELRLLLVCHGNSCRSPMAEGIVRARLAHEGLLGRVVVDSAGTSAGDPGAPPNWRALDSPEAAVAGGAWATAGRTPLLRVPSALVPREANYLVNPAHPDTHRIKVRPPEPLEWDARLFGVPSPT